MNLLIQWREILELLSEAKKKWIERFTNTNYCKHFIIIIIIKQTGDELLITANELLQNAPHLLLSLCLLLGSYIHAID